MIKIKNKEVKQELDFLVDVSFFVYNGTFGQKRECSCVVSGKPNSSCEKCEGKGQVLLANKDGFVTGGIYTIFKLITEYMQEGYNIELVFDPPKANLDRSQLIDNYKGNRAPKPEYITAQMNLAAELFPLTKNIRCYTSDNDESDDVLTTRAIELANLGHKVILASDDKDMFPVLDHPNITLLRQKNIFTRKDFIAKFGFEPKRFSEYLGIVGDAADNYNLIKGLGPKAAEWFIEKYDDIAKLWDDWKNIPDKYKKKLVKSCIGDTCLKCKRCDNHSIESNSTIKLVDELDTSLKLAYLNTTANYYRLENKDDYQQFYDKLQELELRSALYNINLFF